MNFCYVQVLFLYIDFATFLCLPPSKFFFLANILFCIVADYKLNMLKKNFFFFHQLECFIFFPLFFTFEMLNFWGEVLFFFLGQT